MSLGTSGTVYAYSNEPVVDQKGNIAAFVHQQVAGYTAVYYELYSYGRTCEIYCANIVNDNFKPLIKGKALPRCLLQWRTHPKLTRCKGLYLRPNAQNVRSENIMRSAVEGATFALRFGLNELAELGVSANESYLQVGAQIAGHGQIVADILIASYRTQK